MQKTFSDTAINYESSNNYAGLHKFVSLIKESTLQKGPNNWNIEFINAFYLSNIYPTPSSLYED